MPIIHTNETSSIDKASPASPDDLFAFLDSIKVSYRIFRHKPIFTVAEGLGFKDDIPGTHCRNLFLKDKKNVLFLVVAANETKIDLKKLPALIGSDRLSFGSPERLWDNLGVRPGSVCPFAAINDKGGSVKIVLDAFMMDADLVNYHPLINDMSITVTPAGLVRFLRATGHEPHILDLTPAAPDLT